MGKTCHLPHVCPAAPTLGPQLGPGPTDTPWTRIRDGPWPPWGPSWVLTTQTLHGPGSEMASPGQAQRKAWRKTAQTPGRPWSLKWTGGSVMKWHSPICPGQTLESAQVARYLVMTWPISGLSADQPSSHIPHLPLPPHNLPTKRPQLWA